MTVSSEFPLSMEGLAKRLKLRWAPLLMFFVASLFLSACGEKMHDCTRHDKEGNLKYTVPCNEKGVYMGEYLEYHKSGKLWKRSYYVDGIEEDTSRLFFYKTGKVLKETPMKAGKAHGEVRTFRESGVLEQVETYVEGEKTGSARNFYESGALKEVFEYQANTRTGPYQFFSPDGEVIVEGEYYKDVKYGKWRHFDYTGHLLAIFTYYNDQKQGGFTVYNPEGMPFISGDFMQNILHGNVNYYDQEGSIVKTEKWNNGTSLSQPNAKRWVDGKAVLPLSPRSQVFIMPDTVWIN